MPLLGAAIISALSALTTFFATYVTKKIAVGAALVATWLAIGVAMLGALAALKAGITYALPQSQWVTFALYVMNSTGAATFISVCASAELVLSAYAYQKATAKAISFIT